MRSRANFCGRILYLQTMSRYLERVIVIILLKKKLQLGQMSPKSHGKLTTIQRYNSY